MSGRVNLELVEVSCLRVSWTLLIRSQVDAARLMSQTNRRVRQKGLCRSGAAVAEPSCPYAAAEWISSGGAGAGEVVVCWCWWCGPACLLPVDPTTVHGAPAESGIQCKEKEGAACVSLSLSSERCLLSVFIQYILQRSVK